MTVRVIPMAEATGSWKGKASKFWVYGNDKVAYAPRYNKDFYHGCFIMYCVCCKQRTNVTFREQERVFSLRPVECLECLVDLEVLLLLSRGVQSSP